MNHIERARKARRQRATLLDKLGQGDVRLEEIIAEPGVLGNTDVWDVLRRAHKLGREGARHTLQKSGVWPHTKMDLLSDDERRAIISNLPSRAKDNQG